MRFQITILLASVTWAGAQVIGISAGVNKNTGERPARLNINDLYAQGGPAWDLFIQALAVMENGTESDWYSYYQIAGIHGLPYKAWNGVEQVEGGAPTGYCPHGEITFATWHRPYVALLEQVLQSHAETIAKQYSGASAETYKSAAQTLRFPYWDWAVSANLPPVTTIPTLQINGPAGSVTMRNPLYSYQFQTFPFTDPDFIGDISQFNETKRCASGGTASDGINNFDGSNQFLSGDQSMLQDQVYAVFTQSKLFEIMTTTSSRGSSFESPHNSVHTDVSCARAGRLGHMAYLGWSAFDPIFFLHHTNVDRLVAMWQAIYYTDAMFNSTAYGDSLFASAAGNLTSDSPLKPFKDGNGVFYTSKAVTSTRTFGYTYPGIKDWELSPEDLASQVMAQVNTLYGRNTPKTRATRRGNQRNDNATPTLKDYSAEISVDRADLTLPCSISLYIGNQTAGEFALLAMPTTGMGYSTIPLLRTLESMNLKLDSPETVVDTLKKDMRLVIKSRDGSVIPNDSVRSLGIEIQDRDFTPSGAEDEFPRYGQINSWPVNTGSLS